MPNKPPVHRPCPGPQRRPPDHRPSAAKRGYNATWRRFRLHILERDHYLCQECKRQGRLTAVGKSGHVDHIKAHRGDPALMWDPENCEALCVSCHSRKTAKEDGGFGR